MTIHIGMLLFPRLTQLDLTAPFELFHRIPGVQTHLLWKDREPVHADSGLGLLPTMTLAESPKLDVLFVPGGWGQFELMNDEVVLRFLSEQGATARFVTSVCTGSLLLGAAGLLEGYQAATHWAFMDLLPAFGATPVESRVVVDRNRITAGGVTAGLDFGLRVIEALVGAHVAKCAQLAIEYDPAPPFRCGHPRDAEPEVLAAVKAAMAERREKRLAQLGGLPRR